MGVIFREFLKSSEDIKLNKIKEYAKRENFVILALERVLDKDSSMKQATRELAAYRHGVGALLMKLFWTNETNGASIANEFFAALIADKYDGEYAHVNKF